MNETRRRERALTNRNWLVTTTAGMIINFKYSKKMIFLKKMCKAGAERVQWRRWRSQAKRREKKQMKHQHNGGPFYVSNYHFKKKWNIMEWMLQAGPLHSFLLIISIPCVTFHQYLNFWSGREKANDAARHFLGKLNSLKKCFFYSISLIDQINQFLIELKE